MKYHDKSAKYLNRLVTLLVIVVVIIFASILYMFKGPIDIINNKTWKLTTDRGQYYIGDTVNVHAVADKLKSVGGHFTRTIECEGQSQSTKNSYTTYDIGESKVNENRPPGHVDTNISVKIPYVVPVLPATCRIGFVLDYNVYSFRAFSEYNFTNTFTLLPPASTVSIPSSVSLTYTSPSTPRVSTPSSSQSSIGSTSPTVNIVSPKEQPGLLEQLVSPVTNLLSKVL